jgi:hypothetical protein
MSADATVKNHHAGNSRHLLIPKYPRALSHFDLPSRIAASQISPTGPPKWAANPSVSWRVRMGELQRASDQESLRLVLAFFRIDDPSQRLAVITLAEWFADEACSGPRGSSPPFS